MKLLNKRLDYAFSALQHIKANNSRKVLASEIAEAGGMPTGYLSKILRSLVEAKIIESHFGVRGGYTLARAPEEITFMDVFEAVSGGFVAVECLEKARPPGCSREASCTHKPIWEKVGQNVRELLQRRTLGDI